MPAEQHGEVGAAVVLLQFVLDALIRRRRELCCFPEPAYIATAAPANT
jgi:hypothetical protein